MKCELCCGTGEIVHYFLQTCAECNILEQRLQGVLDEIAAHFLDKQDHLKGSIMKSGKSVAELLQLYHSDDGQVQENYPNFFPTEYQNSNLNQDDEHEILIPQVFPVDKDGNESDENPLKILSPTPMIEGYVKNLI